MINFTNITKFYKKRNLEYRALYDVSFNINPGDYVFICGDRGSGKTTLLNILGCVSGFDYGKYTFYGMDIGSKKDRELSELRNERFCFIPKGDSLISELNLFENVGIPLLYSKFSKEEKRRRILKYLSMLSIDKYKYLHIDSICRRDRKMICIARALVGGGDIIIADELFEYLDEKDCETIFNILFGLNKKGATLVISGNKLNKYSYGSRVINLRDGMKV